MATYQETVGDFLAQKRVAVVGVRTTRVDAADGIYDKFKETGYEVFPVNPKTTEYKGDRCYSSLGAIPGGVDLAVIITRLEVTEQVVRECHEVGVKRVWMHRSMGNSYSPEAVAFCKEHGIAVLPGGCPMMFLKPVDVAHKCFRFFGKLNGWMPQQV